MPINSGQNLILVRLNEGPLLLVSFTHGPGKVDKESEGMSFTDSEGKTRPVKKLITDGEMRFLSGGAWTGKFTMDATHAEPKGYLAITQTPDNILHLLSSNLYYKFNLKWLEEPNKEYTEQK